jgi:hypothetical protein
MANLTALREKVKNVIDYSPELQQFNDQLDQLINDAYYSLWTFKRWNFATKTTTFPFYVDILPTRDIENAVSGIVNANVIQGDRRVVFSAVMDRLTFFGAKVWEGQPISIQNFEYTISKVISGNTILLDRQFQGKTNSDDISWVIKKRWYDLPEDSLELLYLGHRDFPYNTAAGSFPPFGKATAILPRREEEADLRGDYKASYAEAYIWAPAYQVPAAEKLSLVAATVEGLGTKITANTYWELCWAFVKDGKIGALSQPEKIQVTGQNNAIVMKFIGWDDTEIKSAGYIANDDIAPAWEGCRKVIFWNKNFDKISGERKGLPCWISLQNGGVVRANDSFSDYVVVDDTVSTYTIQLLNQFDNGNRKYIEIDGQHNRIRPYPRVDAWDFVQAQKKSIGLEPVIIEPHDFIKEAIIRYYKKPYDLVLGTDSPEMPYEFHQLIIYKALEDIYLKLGQQSLAATYRARIDKDIKDLMKRYVDHIDSQVIRGQFSVGNKRFYYDYASLKKLT